ncbi:MAG: hypothetical protein QOK07_706 [Gemmatimonadaceae bacterium]|jgi:hypothetical protein|nr:hypothetical protein [Gemmatimonadaceae bacterium]
MIRSRFLRSSVLVLSAFVALSCSDSPTAPTPAAPVSAIRAGTQQDALLGGLLGGVLKVVTSVVGFVADATGLTIHPIAWNSSYTQVSYSVSGTITPWGGTLTIPQSDFTITFPAGAVAQSTFITVTSDPKYVAYKMSPEGTKFAKPVVVTQRLRKTAASGQPLTTHKLFGAYIKDDLLDLSQLLHALEIELSATLYVPGSSTLPDVTTWTVNHFSRYMLASD